MEWSRIRNRLRAAEGHLDLAVSTSASHLVQLHLRRAQEAYASAMSALEQVGLNSEEQDELERQMRELSARLHSLEHRSR